MNKKKFIWITVIVAAVVVIGIITFLLLNKEEKEDKKLITENYSMLVEINPTVKINYEIAYYKCGSKVCSDYEDKVVDLILVNDDAKALFAAMDLTDKSLNDALVSLASKAKESGVDITNISVTTSWALFEEKLSDSITRNMEEKTAEDVSLNLVYSKDIDIQNEVTYTVTFDTDGGNSIDPQEVVKGEKIVKPSAPEKAGYTFISWELNGKEYDFASEVTENITLKATWQKVLSNNPNADNSEIPKEENNNSSTSLSQKELDNEEVRYALEVRGLEWDFYTREDLNTEYLKWVHRGFSGETYEIQLGQSDPAFSLIVRAGGRVECNLNEEVVVDWRNEIPEMASATRYIIYLGYNCAGATFNENGVSYTVNENNEIVPS